MDCEEEGGKFARKVKDEAPCPIFPTSEGHAAAGTRLAGNMGG
jgi:hypothetical protein